MKKLILSAVMMMAFVGTSMAKTKEVDKVTFNSSIGMFLLKTDPCVGVWNATYIYAANQGFGDELSADIATAAARTCRKLAE